MTHVLLVEDSPTICELLRGAFEGADMQVTCVENGTDVAATARKLKPAVIVLNKMLPGMDGYAVLRQLRASHETSGIRVMMLTESSRRDDVVKGIETGADDYVVKPFDPANVAMRVQALAQR